MVAAVDKRLWELEHEVRAARERRVGVDGDAVVAEQRVDIRAQMEAVAEVHGHGEIDGSRGLADQFLGCEHPRCSGQMDRHRVDVHADDLMLKRRQRLVGLCLRGCGSGGVSLDRLT